MTENKLYAQLSPLGFAEWLEKNFETLMSLDEWFKDADKEEINSSERTVMNALAFRWLREEKKLECSIHQYYTKYTFDIRKFEYKGHYSVIIYTDRTFNAECHPTHSLAEHEALNKALEILSKGGDDETT